MDTSYEKPDGKMEGYLLELEDKLVGVDSYLQSGVVDHENLSSYMAQDILQDALHSPQELNRIQQFLTGMAEDGDSMVRLTIMKIVPRFALLFLNEDRTDLVDAQLWPLLYTCLADENEEVRKAGEVSLLFLLKKYLLRDETIDEQVCPRIIEISKMDGFAGMVTLMGKMAVFIGKEATEKHFLDRFIHLCSNEDHLIREKCAKSLGDMCTGLGNEATEKYLLPIFVEMCRDESVEVRLFCVRAAISVSCACSLAARKTVLATAFTELLMDSNSCVRVAAYVVLGAFICTFANPSITYVDYDENGELVFAGQEGYRFRIRTMRPNSDRDCFQREGLFVFDRSFSNDSDMSNSPLSNFFRLIHGKSGNHLGLEGVNPNQRFLRIMELTMPQSLRVSEDKGSNVTTRAKKTEKEDMEEIDDSFNTFRFWRVPLPQLDLLELGAEQEEIKADLNILDNELSSLSKKLVECSAVDVEENKSESVISSPDSGWSSAEATPHTDTVSTPDSKAREDMGSKSVENEEDLPKQEIVPQRLLDYFVSMTVPLHADTLDQEIPQDCAYFLPAVVLTLGPSNWPYIKNAYKCLSINIKWRVRKRVASSIHELAAILGEEIASEDLAPIFFDFMGDLEEVKIGALEHLADFLKLVNSATRNSFLPRLKEFLNTDFDWNWRYREKFGEQLRFLINLFTPADWLEHFEPLATQLLCDKVAAVRQKALLLFLDLITNLSMEPGFREKMLDKLIEEFAENSSWRRRQIFVLLCSEIAKKKAVDEEYFCKSILEHLVKLGKDSVVNVVLCVARCLSGDVVSTGFISPSSPNFATIEETLETLKNNEDPDVQYFATLHEVKDAVTESDILTEQTEANDSFEYW